MASRTPVGAGAVKPAASSFSDGFFNSSPFLVVVKIKPSDLPGDEVLDIIKPNVLKLVDDPSTPQDDTREMPFEVVVPATAAQEDIYECCGRPILERVLSGYNGCILAYGSSGLRGIS
jgi:hypothetical protein